MAETIKYSEVKVLSNYPTDLARLNFNLKMIEDLDSNGVVVFFKRNALVQNRLTEVLIGIDANGKFDKYNRYALPCPPYCDDDKPPAQFQPEMFFQAPFTDEHYRLLENKGASGFLNLRIIIPSMNNGPNIIVRTAMIGVNSDGDIMKKPDDIVVYAP